MKAAGNIGWVWLLYDDAEVTENQQDRGERWVVADHQKAGISEYPRGWGFKNGQRAFSRKGADYIEWNAAGMSRGCDVSVRR